MHPIPSGTTQHKSLNDTYREFTPFLFLLFMELPIGTHTAQTETVCRCSNVLHKAKIDLTSKMSISYVIIYTTERLPVGVAIAPRLCQLNRMHVQAAPPGDCRLSG